MISRDEWLKALGDAGLNPPSDEEAMTVHEFMELFNLTRYTADRRLQALARAGRATRTHKYSAAPDGRMRHHIAYRLR